MTCTRSGQRAAGTTASMFLSETASMTRVRATTRCHTFLLFCDYHMRFDQRVCMFCFQATGSCSSLLLDRWWIITSRPASSCRSVSSSYHLLLYDLICVCAIASPGVCLSAVWSGLAGLWQAGLLQPQYPRTRVRHKVFSSWTQIFLNSQHMSTDSCNIICVCGFQWMCGVCEEL